MLREIGARSMDQLFSHIPEEYRLNRPLDIPRQMAESEIIDYFRVRAAETSAGFSSFLGAGAYGHYRPVVIDSLVSRGEFFTAYTPYQPEASQGTLRSIYEYQTMIAELTGMDVANASIYDGASSLAEAAQVAGEIRLGERRPHVEGTGQPRLRGHARQQVLDGAGPDDVEHLAPVLLGVRQVAHQCPPSATSSSYCAAVRSSSHSAAFAGLTTIIQPWP